MLFLSNSHHPACVIELTRGICEMPNCLTLYWLTSHFLGAHAGPTPHHVQQSITHPSALIHHAHLTSSRPSLNCSVVINVCIDLRPYLILLSIQRQCSFDYVDNPYSLDLTECPTFRAAGSHRFPPFRFTFDLTSLPSGFAHPPTQANRV